MTTSYKHLSRLFEIAVNLAAGLHTEERFERLLAAAMEIIPCDAAAILKLEDNTLHPVAQLGLAREVMGRRFQTNAHPRLGRIIANEGVTRFDEDSQLADPYDGLVPGLTGNLPVHSCMGSRLRVNGNTWGVITFDAMHSAAFTDISDQLVLAFSELAAAAASAADYVARLEHSALREHEINQNLLDQVISHTAREMVGDSPAMQALHQELDLVAPSELAVMVAGESGSGKELVARAIHMASARKKQPMVYLNCAALPEQLVESELFGHRKGAFTGAVRDYKGKFELAHQGTLFLDEIGELPLEAQAKLLRTLQSGEVQPLGSEAMLMVDVRIIAATNRDLKEEVMQGRFREDLFHRLCVYPIRVPPLRERITDIAPLAGFFIENLSAQMGLRGVYLSGQAEQALCQYNWPGNVRELEHVISRALLRVRQRSRAGPTAIMMADLDGLNSMAEPAAKHSPAAELSTSEAPLSQLMDLFQAQTIQDRVASADGNWSRAAESLGLHRSNLHRLAKRLGVK